MNIKTVMQVQKHASNSAQDAGERCPLLFIYKLCGFTCDNENKSGNLVIYTFRCTFFLSNTLVVLYIDFLIREYSII